MPFAFLSGIKVLDLSQYLPGPLATQILSDLGAEVVKVEPPAGDPQLRLDPMSGALDRTVLATGNDHSGAVATEPVSPFYSVLNAGKQVVRLDLKSDDGKSAFADILASADVILESFRPGVMDRLGFGYEAARRLNPGVIYCSLSGYGQTGPRRLAAGHDLNYMAFSGALSQAGDGSGPAMAWPPMADCAGAVTSALSILGALVRKGTSGEGVYLDVAMSDCVLSWQAIGLTAEKLGLLHKRGDSLLTGGAACYRVYETADREFLSVGALEEIFWQNFCEAIGHGDWTARQWDPLPQRELIDAVSNLLATEPLAHWMMVLADVDTCIQPVATYGDIAAHDQVQARGLVRDKGMFGVEVLLPILANGLTSGDRAAVRLVDADRIARAWGAGKK